MSSTTYGTISTISHSPFSSPANNQIRSGIGIRRPWKEMASVSLPESLNDALHRINTNASYFHVNYAIIVLFTLFLSLLWHPISLLVFIAAMVAWLFLYFLRDRPVVVFGYGVDARVILVVLSIFTVALLLLTRAAVFLAGLAVGLAAVAVHGALRGTEDLVGEEEAAGHERVNLKETASSSYSSQV